MSTSVPPDTSSWEEAVTHGFFGERTDPLPDSLYVPGIQADLSPTVTTLSPASGPEGGMSSVTITGTLLFSPVVTFGGQTAMLMHVAEDGTSVQCASPAGTGVVDVVVTTPGGSVTKEAAFTYEAPPPPEKEVPEA